MAWLAVDKNGDELISEGEPSRNSKYKVWEYETSIEGEIINFVIDLPKGSIKKLIGRDLTWDDDYVRLDSII